tara:strand:+ start:2936 stop:3490 length:555 start_codon:yes stop_codon:yes gene_type:complete
MGKNLRRVLEYSIWFVFLLVIFPSSSAYAQEPPAEKECILYAYTYSENHYFLIQSNSSIFGQSVIVEHNCESISVSINGSFYASSESNLNFQIESGVQSITFSSQNKSWVYENVSVYPDRLDWEYDFNMLNDRDSKFIDIKIANTQINWAVAMSITIVWVLSTYVYWSLISSYVDKNFIEEVVQ